jgi:hypothetical protein
VGPRSGWVWKSHHSLGFNPQTVQPIASKIYLLIYFIDIVCEDQNTFKYNAVENIVHAFILLVLFTEFRDRGFW